MGLSTNNNKKIQNKQTAQNVAIYRLLFSIFFSPILSPGSRVAGFVGVIRLFAATPLLVRSSCCGRAAGTFIRPAPTLSAPHPVGSGRATKQTCLAEQLACERLGRLLGHERRLPPLIGGKCWAHGACVSAAACPRWRNTSPFSPVVVVPLVVRQLQAPTHLFQSRSVPQG